MGRLALAAIVVTTTAGVGLANPTRKVQVETEPAGATIYLDDVDKGPVCDATPCTFTSPLGKHTLVLRLDKYEPDFTDIDVTKAKKTLVVKFKLKSALGTLVFDAPKGAAIRIDDADAGKVPAQVTVSSGEGHRVVVAMNGKTFFDDFVEVATGDEQTIKPKGGAATTAVAETDTTVVEEKSSGGGGGGGGSASLVDEGAPSPKRSRFITIAAAVDVGFRLFTYSEATSGNLAKETEDGQTIAGPAVEFFPGRLLGIHFLRGLSLFGRIQFNAIGLAVSGGDLTMPVKTVWGSYEASLRHRWSWGDLGIEVGGGYVQDSFHYQGISTDVLLLPDAEYTSLRVGGKLDYDGGSVMPYISGENRIVFSGGTLEERLRNGKTTGGWRAAGGLVLHFTDRLWARVEGGYLNYSWTFSPDPGDAYRAKGATDSIKLISILAAYTY